MPDLVDGCQLPESTHRFRNRHPRVDEQDLRALREVPLCRQIAYCIKELSRVNVFKANGMNRLECSHAFQQSGRPFSVAAKVVIMIDLPTSFAIKAQRVEVIPDIAMQAETASQHGNTQRPLMRLKSRDDSGKRASRPDWTANDIKVQGGPPQYLCRPANPERIRPAFGNRIKIAESIFQNCLDVRVRFSSIRLPVQVMEFHARLSCKCQHRVEWQMGLATNDTDRLESKVKARGSEGIDVVRVGSAKRKEHVFLLLSRFEQVELQLSKLVTREEPAPKLVFPLNKKLKTTAPKNLMINPLDWSQVVFKIGLHKFQTIRHCHGK